MADDDAGRIGALRLEQRELRQPDRRHDGVGRDRETGPSRCLPGGPVDALLGRRDPRLVGPDLADDPGADAGLPHPVGRLADELVGQVVHGPALDQRLGRVVGGPVPARAHDDVQSGRRRQAAQPLRVALHPGRRDVHEGRSRQGP